MSKLTQAIKRCFLYIGLYMGLALAGLAIAALLIYLGIRLHVRPDSARPSLFLAAWTGFLLWWVVKSYRQLWKRLSFWLAMLALVAAHVPMWLLVLRRYPQWRPVWFIPFVILEILLFGVILDTLFQVKPQTSRTNDQ